MCAGHRFSTRLCPDGHGEVERAARPVETGELRPSPKDYTAVIKSLEAYSKTPGGRSWIADYWLGSSYCHNPGKQAKGLVELRRALDSKDVPPEGAAAAETVRSSCGHIAAGAAEPAFVLTPVFGQQAAGYAGRLASASSPARSTSARSSSPPSLSTIFTLASYR